MVEDGLQVIIINWFECELSNWIDSNPWLKSVIKVCDSKVSLPQPISCNRAIACHWISLYANQTLCLALWFRFLVTYRLSHLHQSFPIKKSKISRSQCDQSITRHRDRSRWNCQSGAWNTDWIDTFPTEIHEKKDIIIITHIRYRPFIQSEPMQSKCTSQPTIAILELTMNRYISSRKKTKCTYRWRYKTGLGLYTASVYPTWKKKKKISVQQG